MIGEDYPYDKRSFDELIRIANVKGFARRSGTATERWAPKIVQKNSSPLRGGVPASASFGGVSDDIRNFVERNKNLILFGFGLMCLIYFSRKYF